MSEEKPGRNSRFFFGWNILSAAHSMDLYDQGLLITSSLASLCALFSFGQIRDVTQGPWPMKWYSWSIARFYSIFFILCLVCILSVLNAHAQSSSHPGQSGWKKKYFRTGLDEHLSYKIFAKAMAGRRNWSFQNSDLLTIIDFSQPSTEKRCYVVDLKKEKLLHRTYVAHGRETGMTYARQFSNIPESHQSSLGFFRTAETYRGKHGYSLRLDGLERNINDQARDRAIVIHAADYAGEEFVQQHGRLGRSLGCPALPPDESRAIISRIKEGSCLFVYANDRGYLTMSSAFTPSG